jgi:sulfur-carrier protein
MPVKVFLSSTLRKYLPDYDPVEGAEFLLEEEMTVRDLCGRMKLPVTGIKLVLVNGKGVSLDYILRGNERLSLFPAVGGG